MRSIHLVPIAVLAFAVACTENASNPAENSRPQFGAGGNPANPAYKSSLFGVASSANFGLSHGWRQTGLGSFTVVNYLLTADFTATAHCDNPGGNTVQGQPFQISGSASSGPQPQTPRNGQINTTETPLTLEISALPPCQPPGGNPHSPVLDRVDWFNIKFCWGGQASNLQGPVPNGVGSNTTLGPGATAAGDPLTGSQSAQDGIFSTNCQDA
jgi:hypothetical protein